jgi:hypothetical protein
MLDDIGYRSKDVVTGAHIRCTAMELLHGIDQSALAAAGLMTSCWPLSKRSDQTDKMNGPDGALIAQLRKAYMATPIEPRLVQP